jgi:hypothetical protein
LIGHDGYFVAVLRLFDIDEGGRSRVVQSGFRADWIVMDDGLPDRGPLDLLGGRSSVKPGEEALIRIYPFSPGRWASVHPGSRIPLAGAPRRQGRRNGNGVRVVGSAEITERMDVPFEAVGLRQEPDRRRPESNRWYRVLPGSAGGWFVYEGRLARQLAGGSYGAPDGVSCRRRSARNTVRQITWRPPV